MIRLSLALLLLTVPAMAADDTCKELKGPERAACETAQKGRSEEMKGVGAQGKGRGAEQGNGIAKQAEDKVKDKVKDKAKGKAKEKRGK